MLQNEVRETVTDMIEKYPLTDKRYPRTRNENSISDVVHMSQSDLSSLFVSWIRLKFHSATPFQNFSAVLAIFWIQKSVSVICAVRMRSLNILTSNFADSNFEPIFKLKFSAKSALWILAIEFSFFLKFWKPMPFFCLFRFYSRNISRSDLADLNFKPTFI